MKSPWISSRKKPKHGGYVLAAHFTEDFTNLNLVWWNNGLKKWRSPEGDLKEKINYWMEIPDSPI